MEDRHLLLHCGFQFRVTTDLLTLVGSCSTGFLVSTVLLRRLLHLGTSEHKHFALRALGSNQLAHDQVSKEENDCNGYDDTIVGPSFTVVILEGSLDVCSTADVV